MVNDAMRHAATHLGKQNTGMIDTVIGGSAQPQPVRLAYQPAVLFSQNKSAPVISHQPNEQTAITPIHH
jgi:hypothetical protein